jgi:glycosyltransferase involved in cell wall biosynthesis
MEGPASRVTVAIPVRNEAATIEQLLASLLAQTLPPDEIVVADGGSTDGTASVCARWAGRGVRVMEIGRAFPGRGRNRAAEVACNDWIAFIDAGCVAAPGWLESMVETARSRGASVVYGNYDAILPDEWAVAQALALLPPKDPATGCRPPFVASSLMHRAVWRDAGGFPEHLRAAEDLIFFENVGRIGATVARCCEAKIQWTMPATARAVFDRLRLYSEHHLRAGLGRTWHLRVMVMDLGAVAVASLAVVRPLALALVVSAFFARVVSSVWKRRRNVAPHEHVSAFRWDRLLRVAALVLLADAATWAGSLDYLRWRARGGTDR